MQPKIFETKDGYDIVNHNGTLFHVVASAKGKIAFSCGTVGDTWKGSGRLLRKIPNSMKRLFFSLNKTDK